MKLLQKLTGGGAQRAGSEKHGRGEPRHLMRRPGGGDGFPALQTLRQEMDRAFERMWRGFETKPALPGSMTPMQGLMPDWPALDVTEDDKALTLKADVPGLGPEDIDIEVSGNMLTLRGARSEEKSERKQGIYVSERRSGCFQRTVPLPDYVDRDKIEARYDKGILTVSVPKVPGKGPKRVKVGTT